MGWANNIVPWSLIRGPTEEEKEVPTHRCTQCGSFWFQYGPNNNWEPWSEIHTDQMSCLCLNSDMEQLTEERQDEFRSWLESERQRSLQEGQQKESEGPKQQEKVVEYCAHHPV